MRPSPRILPLLLLVVLVAAAAAQAQVSSSPKVRAVAYRASRTSPLHRSIVPPAAQTRISAVLGREQRPYRATAEERGFRVENSRHGISAEFTSSGIALRKGSNQWGMRLSEYGYKAELQQAKAATPHADANRVEYRRPGLIEWYLNGPLGLEQGFTLSRAPGKPAGPLTLGLTLSGDLTATLDPGASGLTLKKDGTAVVHYGALSATDARGRELRAWIELAQNRLSLRVDDASAQYPVTVDPLVQAAVLTASDGTEGGLGVGVSVSGDGDTIAAGAPFFSDQVGTEVGAVFVFVKPGTGWADTSNFTAELVQSDRQNGSTLGVSVGVSSDGSTIVAGSGNSARGGVLVFVKSGSGWASSCTATPCVLTESAQLTPSTSEIVFGNVAISGDGTTIAAHGGTGADDVFIFVKPTNGWTSSSPLHEVNSLTGADSFGTWTRLSADGTTLASGAPLVQIGSNDEQGEVEIFVTTDGWMTVSSNQLVASDGAAFDALGSEVAISDDGGSIVASSRGRAYVFVKTGSNWGSSTETQLVNSDSSEVIAGRSVGISGDSATIVVGGVDLNTAAGTAYVFVKPVSGWSSSSPLHEAAKLPAGDNGFAEAVTASADSSTIVAGDSMGSGAVYVFTGSAASPTASLSTTSLTFGNQAAGTTSATQTVMLTNTGTAALHVSAVSASTNFTTTQNCVTQSPIAAGGNCFEDVAFAPGSVGPFTGSLTFTDDSGGTAGAMQTVNLSGTGVKETTSTTITSASPNPALVNRAVTFSFSVTPPTGDTLTPTGTVTVTASTGENCTGAAPSSSCSITFTSPVTRTVTASYGGDSNFISSTSANVSEQVVDFSLSVSPSSQTIPPGHLTSYTLTATSINGFTGTLTLACTALPPHSSCAISPASVNLSNSTAMATVQIDQENKGTYTLTFTGSYGAVAAHAVTASLTVK